MKDTSSVTPARCSTVVKCAKPPTITMQIYHDTEDRFQEESAIVVQITDIVHKYTHPDPEDSDSFDESPKLLVAAPTMELANKAMCKIMNWDTSKLNQESGMYWPPNDKDFLPYASDSEIWVITHETPGMLTLIALYSLGQYLTVDQMNTIRDTFSDLYIEGSG